MEQLRVSTTPPIMRLLLFVALLALSACDPSQDFACTLEARAGLEVVVEDAVTGASLKNATVEAQSESFTETLEIVSAGLYAGAYERPGTYTVRAAAPGYRAQERTGVEVRADVCHVQTVRLTLRLRPA